MAPRKTDSGVEGRWRRLRGLINYISYYLFILLVFSGNILAAFRISPKPLTKPSAPPPGLQLRLSDCSGLLISSFVVSSTFSLLFSISLHTPWSTLQLSYIHEHTICALVRPLSFLSRPSPRFSVCSRPPQRLIDIDCCIDSLAIITLLIDISTFCLSLSLSPPFSSSSPVSSPPVLCIRSFISRSLPLDLTGP